MGPAEGWVALHVARGAGMGGWGGGGRREGGQRRDRGRLGSGTGGVGEGGGVLFRNENIFWLDVAVDDALHVHVCQPVENLSEHAGGPAPLPWAEDAGWWCRAWCRWWWW